MSTDTKEIYSEIYNKLAENDSLFPAFPQTAMRIRDLINDDDCNVSDVATLLKADPALTALIMRAATSVRFLSVFPPKDIDAAIGRIGLRTTSELVTAFALRSVFVSSSSELKTLLQDTYHQSTKIAILAYFLAEKTSRLSPAKAMLAGLLQDISLPPILLSLSKRPEIFNDLKLRTEAIDHLAPKVGALILKKWKFNKEMIEAVRSRKQWMRDGHKKPDLGDIILIARIHSMIGTPEINKCPSLPDIPAFGKFDLGELTPDQSLEILDDAKDEIAELNQLLA
ncbi:MAG: HDOD domain-containing protein [Pseudomonadales bacterium]|nr:HDOD domain-containing protein [Pseudomonadales bacterium]